MLLVCGTFQVAIVWNDKNQCLVVVVGCTAQRKSMVVTWSAYRQAGLNQMAAIGHLQQTLRHEECGGKPSWPALNVTFGNRRKLLDPP